MTAVTGFAMTVFDDLMLCLQSDTPPLRRGRDIFLDKPCISRYSIHRYTRVKEASAVQWKQGEYWLRDAVKYVKFPPDRRKVQEEL